jgi:ATP-dependent Clp protease ATP-binding subunit ClpA
MFERFTNQSRRAVVLAQEEARMLNHNYIGTEHLLLGLLHEGQGSAARALATMDVTLSAARDQVVAIIGRGQAEPSGHIPFTPRAKKSLELSLREALQLENVYIGTGHLLLGLIHQGDNVAVKILGEFGADLKDLRSRVIQELRDHPEDGQQPPAVEREREHLNIVLRSQVQGLLDTIDDRLSAIERHLGITRSAGGHTGAESEVGEVGEVGASAAAGVAGEPDELGRLRARVADLESRLREHGVDPDEPGEAPAAAG